MYRSISKVPGLSIGHCLASLDANIRNWETLLASDETGERIRTPEDVANETAKWHNPPAGSQAASSSLPPPVPNSRGSTRILGARGGSSNIEEIATSKVAFK
jgi:hypothetical protein